MALRLSALTFAVFNIELAKEAIMTISYVTLVTLASRAEYNPHRSSLLQLTSCERGESSEATQPVHEVFVTFDAYRNKQRPTSSVPPLDCAAPSGFLSLSALYSACNLPALFHTGTPLDFETFRGFPHLVATAPHDTECPS